MNPSLAVANPSAAAAITSARNSLPRMSLIDNHTPFLIGELEIHPYPVPHDARDAAAGHEAVVVSHQLPIWTTRLFLEKRSYLHHPKTRQCTLCSLTSVVFDDDHVVQVRYSEPAGDLIPVADRSAPFSAGGAPQEDRP